MPGSPLLPLLIVCIALPQWLNSFFEKKKRRIGQEDSTGQQSDSVESITDLDKAMEELRLNSFEREVISSALTAIYEAEVKGILKVSERDRLAEPYKKKIEFLDQKIEERRKIAELFNLHREKKELQAYYSEKMTEIEKKIRELRFLVGSLPQLDLQTITMSENVPDKTTHPDSSQLGQTPEISAKTKTKTEEKIESLREEVLRAIERLEQIESEG